MITIQEKKADPVTVRLPYTVMEAIEELQYQYGATRSHVIQSLLKQALAMHTCDDGKQQAQPPTTN